MPRYISPQPQYFTGLGIPLTGGLLYFYEPSTLIPKDTYSNAALSIPNTNPIALATNGSPAVDIWLNGVYRVRLLDENGNLQWDKDPVGGDSSDRLAYQDWAAGISYDIGDIVTGSNGRYYVSITEPNINNDPISSAVNWTESRLLRVYNANETYQIGAVVQAADGFLWKAKAITAGSTPAIGSAFWEPAVDGLYRFVTRDFTVISANSAITVLGGPYFVNGNYTVTLPDSATVSVGKAIYVTKPMTATVIVSVGAGPALIEQGRITATFTEATFTIDINSGFWFVFNGTNWVAQ
jgi:hypothetical protein